MKRSFPGVLWLLPICFGLFGGIVAGLIASLKYQASWWELAVAGFAVSFLVMAGYLVVVYLILENAVPF